MNEKVTIRQVIPQDFIKNLQGRSVIVDVLCEKQDGTFINVEVQKSNNDNHQKRVRYNGMEEIYVNTKAEDGSALAELMKIYTELDTYNYERFPMTSIRKAHFKKNEKGVETMCDIVEDYAKQYAKEQLREAEEKMAKKLFKDGMSIEKIVSMMEMLTLEDVKSLTSSIK